MKFSMKMIAPFLLTTLAFIPRISSTENTIQSHACTDLVIYSMDRPLQLYALLESVEHYMTGISTTQVIYRTTSESYARGYDEVFARFTWAQPLKQGANPHLDFKPLMLKAVFESPSAHVLFAVDDIVVKDTINLSECVEALEATHAYGFYLRLGMNLTECYMLRCAQPVPPLHEVASGIYTWQFSQATCDWGYPHTVDMTVFRKKDIEYALHALNYRNPNTFEGAWASWAPQVQHRLGACFAQTRMVTMPLNIVQTDYSNNRHMHGLTAQELLDIFNKGLKMDIAPLHTIINKAAHMEYAPTFIAR